MSSITKYLGIPFKHSGRTIAGIDCYGLVKLFYANELGIILPDYAYDPDWIDRGLNFIEERYWQHFEKIDRIQKHCIITFKGLQTKVVSHMGIMIDDISFLHVPPSLLSCTDKITNILWKRTIHGFYKFRV